MGGKERIKNRRRVGVVSRNDVSIPDGKYFISDLIGLEVIDVDTKQCYGKITDVRNFGASDIYVVSDGKNEYMVPAVKDVISLVDLDKAVYVKPISGIFDEAEEIRS